MRRNPGNAIANARLELQDVIEEILRKHRIDPGDHNYDMRLRMPTYFDPFIGRIDSYESAGQNGDHTSDPVIAMDAGSSYWVPVRIDRAVGDIFCYYIENGRRVMYPDKIKSSFQSSAC